jgi:hypothetical protein
MLNKADVIEALDNGAHILVNDIYRSATVWKDGHRLGSCRFDTAQRLARVAGYTVENLEAWSFSWRIEKQRPEPEENDVVSKNLKKAILVLERGDRYPVNWLSLEEIRWLKSEYGDKLHKTSVMTTNGPRSVLYVCW